METQTQPAGETAQATPKPESKRVVLNLSLQDAKMLSACMQNIAGKYEENCYEKELSTNIYQRIEKTLAKYNGSAENDKGLI